ncbi:MAG: signal peptidase I [Bdellovibrionaceae bacterium]|nr:signal peptidase I [Pseudobdellovibrionaceae bacterium]
MSDLENKREEPTVSRKQWILENIVSLGTAILLVLMIRSSVIEAFKIPSGSMIPTLFVGDHIFVNKFSYGIKVPFSDWIADRPIYLYKRTPPQRGDVIVFKYPKDRSLYYIKRVIGTPGDVIEIRNKKLFINDQLQKRTEVPDALRETILSELEIEEIQQKSLKIFYENLGNGQATILLNENSIFWEKDNFGPITIPGNQYFVMGDNRDSSNDSRFWGFVPIDDIRGKAMVIWLSLWADFNTWDFTFHPERIGNFIHKEVNQL